MRYQLYFTTSNFSSFLHRLKQLNKYLKYFPIPPQNEHVHPLSDNELMEIIDNAKPLEYNQYMLQSNYDPYNKSLEEFCQYLASLELSMTFTAAVSATKSNSSNKKRKERHRTMMMTMMSRCCTSVNTARKWSPTRQKTVE